MTFEIAFVLIAITGMIIALVSDVMRPGMILFSVVVLFLCAGILSPKEMLEGFSNRGMITVALLFLVSEGVSCQLITKVLDGAPSQFHSSTGQCWGSSYTLSWRLALGMIAHVWLLQSIPFY